MVCQLLVTRGHLSEMKFVEMADVSVPNRTVFQHLSKRALLKLFRAFSIPKLPHLLNNSFCMNMSQPYDDATKADITKKMRKQDLYLLLCYRETIPFEQISCVKKASTPKSSFC